MQKLFEVGHIKLQPNSASFTKFLQQYFLLRGSVGFYTHVR